MTMAHSETRCSNRNGSAKGFPIHLQNSACAGLTARASKEYDTLMALLRKLSPLFVALAHVSSGQQPPSVMTKVEVVLEGPDIPAGSFPTKPRVMYRAGSRYCRI